MGNPFLAGELTSPMLPLKDPIEAQEKALELCFEIKTTDDKSKEKLRKRLVIASKKTDSMNQTFVASIYRQALSQVDIS